MNVAYESYLFIVALHFLLDFILLLGKLVCLIKFGLRHGHLTGSPYWIRLIRWLSPANFICTLYVSGMYAILCACALVCFSFDYVAFDKN